MRTTHHLQQIDFTTENATSSRITTSVTATNSTRISTSSSVTKLQPVSLHPITSSKETPFAAVSQTSFHKTYADSNATSVSLIQTYTSNVSPVNLTRATTSRYPKTTHYNLTSANPITSRAPPRSAQTTIYTERTITQAPFTFVHQPTPNNPASIKPTFSTTFIPATTSVYLMFKTRSTYITSRSTFTNKIITPTSSKTSVHIIAGNTHTKTPTPPIYVHRSTSSNSVSLPKSTQSSALLTTITNSTISPVTITSRIPLTPLFTSVFSTKTTAPF